MINVRAKRKIVFGQRWIKKGEVVQMHDEVEMHDGRVHFRFPNGRTYLLMDVNDFEVLDPAAVDYGMPEIDETIVEPTPASAYANNPNYGRF